ncbi:hypothetical protein [Methylobacterium nigriterrae]|uniref:hypothetical protein n=1 Tax=Methylobacterium nigriterrae TaxID=3127512 RepID=UPI003013C93C
MTDSPGFAAPLPSVARAPQAETQTDSLRPWLTLTAIYLSFGAVLLYDRWAEIGPLLEPASAANSAGAAGVSRLPLNSIGDVLGGFFAPLAFLWLFVATLLQRRELKLQREELADTRLVLAEQREELKRSAEENNKQTAIMQRTLEVSRSREVFDEFSLSLYFFARGNAQTLATQLEFNAAADAMGVKRDALFGVGWNFEFSQNEAATVDDFFERLLSRIDVFFDNWGEDVIIFAQSNNNKRIEKTLSDTLELIKITEQNTYYGDNVLVRRRTAGLNFKGLQERVVKLLARFK